MKEVSIKKSMKLSEHYSLGELTKTSYDTLDKNIPSREAIENLRNICENWLEDLRYTYNALYGDAEVTHRVCPSCEQGAPRPDCKGTDPCVSDVPIIISSGYRSEEVNRLCGGAKGSNHLTGCAVDIRCYGPEQMIRMAGILLDISDGTKRDFDELILEKRGTTYWIHFAVRPKDRSATKGDACQSKNRRKILFDCR